MSMSIISLSEKTASRDSNIKKSRKSNKRFINRNKKFTRSVFRLINVRVIKASRKVKSSVHNHILDDVLSSETSSTALWHDNAKTSEESSSKLMSLHRSQCIINLMTKRNQQSEETQQAISKLKSQKQLKNWILKSWKLFSQVRLQKITKSWVTKKKISWAAKQWFSKWSSSSILVHQSHQNEMLSSELILCW